MAGFRSFLVAALLAALARCAAAAEHPGQAVYREHCVRCHGDGGAGTPEVPDPLVGDLSVNQLAAYVDETMPEDDPALVTGPAARAVAEYIHAAFYSPVARDRNRPARLELARLTVRQHRNAVADLVAGFRGGESDGPAAPGLRGEYFRGRGFGDIGQRVLDRIDPEVDFDFGLEGPDPEQFEGDRFAIRWTGSVVPPETGHYEFVVRSAHSIRLWVNASRSGTPLIDAYVQSGDRIEHRGTIFLLGGRGYPLRLEFSKANQGVDNRKHERSVPASIALLWKPPHAGLAVVPGRCLSPRISPPVCVLATPFPPDDRSIGYERGTTVSKDWFGAAASEAAAHVLDHVDELTDTTPAAADRPERLRAFATAFAARAFRRPLSAALEQLVVSRPFAEAPDADTGLKRSLLLALGSPRFLFREPDSTGPADPFAVAARLSFGLWDSIPDDPLWQAAERNELATPTLVRRQAERMVADRRTQAKLRDFLLAWLRVDHGPELTKDAAVVAGFTPECAGDLRTSLLLSLDDVIGGDGSRAADFRRLLTADEVWLNGRLAPLYGADLRPDAPFTPVRLDGGRRAGMLSHPYMMSVLSYTAATSPIHRGVFLARSILGNVLKPPEEAVTPLAPDAHPELTTRQRVARQTRAVACQTCHTMINPLGFALEEFDAVGRFRSAERQGDEEKPIDATGSYLPREGPEATFTGARELGAYLAASRDAHEAFVQALFHAVVKQPVRAWGSETLGDLCRSFRDDGFDIRKLLVDIMERAAFPPPVSVPPSPPEAAP
ncbi:MAG: DUF1592 domain-containing protein [Planctomycetia bacterium]